jgi:hypothetical protein
VSEWIYILWVAVGTTGFWEAVEAMQRIRELDWLPKWTWTVIAGMVPIAWIALMQVYVHPFSLLIYGLISVIYIGMLIHRHQSRWFSVPLLALQLILFFTVPVWHLQADRFWVVIVVEVVAIWLSSKRRRSRETPGFSHGVSDAHVEARVERAPHDLLEEWMPPALAVGRMSTHESKSVVGDHRNFRLGVREACFFACT